MRDSILVDQLRAMLSAADFATLSLLVIFLLTDLLIFLISVFLLTKALLLRRQSELGRRLAENNVAMAAAYLIIFLSVWFPILRHLVVMVVLRLLILTTTIRAILAFVRFYGGWRATGRAVRDSLREIRTEIADEVSGRAHRRRTIERARRLYLSTR